MRILKFVVSENVHIISGVEKMSARENMQISMVMNLHIMMSINFHGILNKIEYCVYLPMTL